jgi:hypothetical protein
VKFLTVGGRQRVGQSTSRFSSPQTSITGESFRTCRRFLATLVKQPVSTMLSSRPSFDLFCFIPIESYCLSRRDETPRKAVRFDGYVNFPTLPNQQSQLHEESLYSRQLRTARFFFLRDSKMATTETAAAGNSKLLNYIFHQVSQLGNNNV